MCLCGIFSLAALMAMVRYPQELPIRQTPWYPKAEATFSDALAAVHHDLWSSAIYRISSDDPDLLLFPKAVALSLFDMACYSTQKAKVQIMYLERFTLGKLDTTPGTVKLFKSPRQSRDFHFQ